MDPSESEVVSLQPGRIYLSLLSRPNEDIFTRGMGPLSGTDRGDGLISVKIRVRMENQQRLRGPENSIFGLEKGDKNIRVAEDEDELKFTRLLVPF